MARGYAKNPNMMHFLVLCHGRGLSREPYDWKPFLYDFRNVDDELHLLCQEEFHETDSRLCAAPPLTGFM